MSSRTLCSRHGFQSFMATSKKLAACIKARGQFEAGQLVKVSLDRPKRSKEVWMASTELADYADFIEYVGKTAHIKDSSTISAIENTLVQACSRCMDELLVRSGEQPATPTSRECAFDNSLVAEDAVVSDSILSCPLHGLVFPKRSSPEIAAAIDSGGELLASRLIKTVLVSDKHENELWFDAEFLLGVLGPEIDLTSSTYRLESGEERDTLLEAAVRVCPLCLSDFLSRSHAVKIV